MPRATSAHNALPLSTIMTTTILTWLVLVGPSGEAGTARAGAGAGFVGASSTTSNRARSDPGDDHLNPPDGDEYLVILALPTGALFATHIIFNVSATTATMGAGAAAGSSSSSSSSSPPPYTVVNTGDFLYGAYGRRALPTTTVMISVGDINGTSPTINNATAAATTPTTTRSTLPLPLPLLAPSCEDVSSLRYYTPTTAFLFPVPQAQQQPIPGGGPPADLGGPRAVVNGSCRLPTEASSSPPLLAAAPVVVSLRDQPGLLPSSLQTAVADIVENVAASVASATNFPGACTLLSDRGWWNVRDLSALRAAMPTPSLAPASDTLTLVAAFAQATADGNVSDGSGAFPAAAYGHTCVQRGNTTTTATLANGLDSEGVGASGGSGRSRGCGGLAVTVPVYALSGLVLAYARLANDTTTTTATATTTPSPSPSPSPSSSTTTNNNYDAMIVAATVFVGGMPYYSGGGGGGSGSGGANSVPVPVTPMAPFRGAEFSTAQDTFSNVLALGYESAFWSSNIMLPSAAYSGPSSSATAASMLDVVSNASAVSNCPETTCPRTMTESIAPRWAWAVEGQYVNTSTCAGFVAAGGHAGLMNTQIATSTSRYNTGVVGLWLSDYLPLTIQAPSTSSSGSNTNGNSNGINNGVWLFPADGILSDLFGGVGGAAFFSPGDPVNATQPQPQPQPISKFTSESARHTESGSPISPPSYTLIPPERSGVYQYGLYASNTFFGYASVTLAPYYQYLNTAPLISDFTHMIQWTASSAADGNPPPTFPSVCPWLWQPEDYNQPRNMRLSVGSHTYSLGPGTLGTVAVSFAPTSSSGEGGDDDDGTHSGGGPLLTTLPLDECVLLGQLTAYLVYGIGGFASAECPAVVAPPIPRDSLGYGSTQLRTAASFLLEPSVASCLGIPGTMMSSSLTTNYTSNINNSSNDSTICPRWPSPFPIVGTATFPFDDQGPPPVDQTSFLTNEEAWCAFNQYIAAAPTGPTMGVSFLCSADRKTVFVVTCGGDRFSADGDVDFDALSSQSPPATGPSWSALWESWIADNNVNTYHPIPANQTRPPYYASLGGVPLMAFDAVNDPSGFRFHCSACLPFVEAGEAPLPYAAVAIAALKDALLIALAVWIMSFRRLQHAATAAVAWLSALVVPFTDPALARRLNRSIAETLRSDDEVTATEIAEASRALAAFGSRTHAAFASAPSEAAATPVVAAPHATTGEGRRPLRPTPPPVTIAAADSRVADRAFEAFLLYYVLRRCQRTVKMHLLEQWASSSPLPPPPPSVAGPDPTPLLHQKYQASLEAEATAANHFRAREVIHHLRGLRLAWDSHLRLLDLPCPIEPAVSAQQPLVELEREQQREGDEGEHTTHHDTLRRSSRKRCSKSSWKGGTYDNNNHNNNIEEEALVTSSSVVVIPEVVPPPAPPPPPLPLTAPLLASSEDDVGATNSRSCPSSSWSRSCLSRLVFIGRQQQHQHLPQEDEEDPDDVAAARDEASRAGLCVATRALWAALESHDLLVPVAFADTAVDHGITPPVWLMLLHLLFCVIYMIIILVTVIRDHGQRCQNPQNSHYGPSHTACVLSGGWHVYQAVFFRYINSTTSVSLIVNGIIRVLYLPLPPPALDNNATFFEPADAALVLQAASSSSAAPAAVAYQASSPRLSSPTQRNHILRSKRDAVGVGGSFEGTSSSPLLSSSPPDERIAREEVPAVLPSVPTGTTPHGGTSHGMPPRSSVQKEKQQGSFSASSLLGASDEVMVAVLRRGDRHFMGVLGLARRCLSDRFVQCGVLLPLPVLLTHALVGAMLYAWVTIPVIGLLVLVAVAADRAASPRRRPEMSNLSASSSSSSSSGSVTKQTELDDVLAARGQVERRKGRGARGRRDHAESTAPAPAHQERSATAARGNDDAQQPANNSRQSAATAGGAAASAAPSSSSAAAFGSVSSDRRSVMSLQWVALVEDEEGPDASADARLRPTPLPPKEPKQSVLFIVTARLVVRVLITFACVLLCQTTVNWMVLAYTGGGGNWRLAYTFADTNDLFAQVQRGASTVPNTFLFRHRFPPPPALTPISSATAGTAAAVERLQDAQFVSYLGVLVREFEARSFACTLEMLAATLDGALQTLSVLF